MRTGPAAEVEFPDGGSFAPTRVRVSIRADLAVRARAGDARRGTVPARASAEAEIGGSGDALPADAEGGGYSGPLAYRQGKVNA